MSKFFAANSWILSCRWIAALHASIVRAQSTTNCRRPIRRAFDEIMTSSSIYKT